MKYDQFQFLYPPRPEQIVMAGMLGVFERKHFVAQVKKNGTGSVIAVSPDKKYHIRTRHGTDHKAWSPTPEILKAFECLPPRWYYFCFELLHSKTKNIKNTMYLHDVLVANNNYLVGVPYRDRYNLLHGLFPVIDCTGQYDVVTENVLIANNYDLGFEHLFSTLMNEEDEGLVLKDPAAELKLCVKVSSNSGGQVKCRIR